MKNEDKVINNNTNGKSKFYIVTPPQTPSQQEIHTTTAILHLPTP